MLDPAALDRARRDWLAGLAATRARAPDAAHTLAHARGAWQCGEYPLALEAFQAAAAMAPHDADTVLSLARAASMLGETGLERATLEAADARGLHAPMLDLHHALANVPHAWDAARARLARHPDDPICALFAAALDTVDAAPEDAPALASPATPSAVGHDPGLQARWQSFEWVMAAAPGRGVHTGQPAVVLARALDAMPAQGLVLECGVYFGPSLARIAARVDGPVHRFDSFQGLPEAWNAHEPAGAYSTAGRLPEVGENVTLHAGWFEDALPAFLRTHPGPVRLLHVDCDLYSSTRTVLDALAGRLVPGTVVVFDDLLGYPGHEQHELRAWTEHVRAHGLHWELVAASLLGREVALRIVSAPGTA